MHYRELQARTLLNRCDSPRMPFRWTVNPYRGCAMGCRYCYAAYTHEFMGMATPEEFHSTVYVKRGHEARTAEDLARLVRKRELIALGTATDPYQGRGRAGSRGDSWRWGAAPGRAGIPTRAPSCCGTWTSE